jgi:hypothetical protein
LFAVMLAIYWIPSSAISRWYEWNVTGLQWILIQASNNIWRLSFSRCIYPSSPNCKHSTLFIKLYSCAPSLVSQIHKPLWLYYFRSFIYSISSGYILFWLRNMATVLVA